jgi:L-histidine Nalpha-methyltransferase
MSETTNDAIYERNRQHLLAVVRNGLSAPTKHLPSWLFYDDAGSRLFERITKLPEYYLTRTEREILAANAQEIIALAAENARLRITELGAGSADKTRLLLEAALAANQQRPVLYEPVDLVASALLEAKERIECEIPGICVTPQVEDYTHGLKLHATSAGERRLVLYIGSSIGNFAADEALKLLRGIHNALRHGDRLLLGVDMVKDEAPLLAAYNDAAGVTARFNRNMLARLNLDAGADFQIEKFAHHALWNPDKSRIEMHLISRFDQQVRIKGLENGGRQFLVHFRAGESIHTENSYKYRPGEAETMLAATGFIPIKNWTDAKSWFTVCLAQAGK